ncbi:MAG: MFS transporter [Alphaproteobacteria bacterium]|nr:MFS transporter [Alphaproteobacteria bacterium]
MATSSTRLSLVFSCIGHACVHLFTAFYFVIVLALERDWGMPYHELIALWTPGALLVGLAALPAGWLGDRWSARGMMVVFFIGMGGASVLCGFASGPIMLAVGLGGIGLFASIYHPVGIAWLIRNAPVNQGKILGLNGIFGSIGIASAAAIGGGLIEMGGWRTAFIVPGVISLVTGFALWLCVNKGLIENLSASEDRRDPGDQRNMVRVFAILMLTMFIGAIVFQSTQTAMPKLFAGRLQDVAGGGALGAGLLVAGVYGFAGIMQVVGGHLADRFPLRLIYIAAFAMQVPLLFIAASLVGLPLLAVSSLMVLFSIGALPAENMLLARHAPERHHGVAFGVKFVLAFGAAPLALFLVSYVHKTTGGFYWLFVALAGFALVCFLATLFLPAGRARTIAGVGAAE